MKKIFTRVISLIVVFALTLSVAVSGVFAEEITGKKALETLEKDIPIIEIPGFADQPIYRGMSTETEEDDVDIWSFPVEDLVKNILKHFPNIVYSIALGKFERLDAPMTEILSVIFGGIACDENGVPSPDTDIRYRETPVKKDTYGKENSYYFGYDWRLDMHTISDQLHEFVKEVLKVTGAESVGLVSFSMGGSVMMTYLYDHYYIASAEERKNIRSAIFISGAMNGVECCEDPFSGNILLDSESLISLLCNAVSGSENTAWLSEIFTLLYSFNAFEPLISYTNNTLVPNLDKMACTAVMETIGTVPAFYGLMSYDRYYEAESFIFNTPEKQERFAGLLEKNRYYHDNVQKNSDKIVESFIADGKNFAVISEYGFPMLPVTSDNSRMADGTIGTQSTSFGATCSAIDGTLGENYIQKVQCECGKNHISPDNQIDASTCKYPDVTWFAKNLKHVEADRYFADIIDLVTYSDEQITVHTYSDFPQYLINVDDTCLVPMTSENAGEAIPFYEKSAIFNLFKNLF